jgi:hypothetical protein
MKRADIKPMELYGYAEDRQPYQYSAVMVLTTNLYMTEQFGARQTVPAPPGRRMQRGNSYRNLVGMPMVYVCRTDHDSVRRLRSLASLEAALDAFNGRDGTDDRIGEPAVLGRYEMLTNAGYLHGGYYELTAALDERKRRNAELEQAQERGRQERLARFNDIVLRLGDLGITGYHAGSWENPSRFEGLTFDDMEGLLDLAEKGAR